MRFAKLHGAGNDFLLFDGGSQEDLGSQLPRLVARLCHRRFGLGADGALLVEPVDEGRARLAYWNADGSRAAFCANGTRCAARFVAQRWGWSRMVLTTDFAEIPATVTGNQATLTLPAPTSLEEWRILAVEGKEVMCRYGVLGVPHLIVKVAWDAFWKRSLVPLAPTLRAHSALPSGGANVNFMQRQGEGGLAVRSWERGVEGETLSCGSGNVLAALVALGEGWVRAPTRVDTASGRVLVVEPVGEPPVCASRLIGMAEWVAEGEVTPELVEESSLPIDPAG